MTWPRLPCHKLCEEHYVKACGTPLQRVHFKCLSCWDRRVHYGKLPKKDFVRKKKVLFQFTHVGKGVLMPKHYYGYFIILKHNRHWWFWNFKNAAVKVLGTITEFIGQL